MPTAINGNFMSDNAAGASAEVLNAMVAANQGSKAPYGNDDLTAALTQRMSELFERDVSVFLVATGTAANGLSLASMLPAWGHAMCHHDAHIYNDECGAPEFFSSGGKLLPVAGEHTRIDPIQLERAVGNTVGDFHTTQSKAVSVSQTTESGCVYSLDQIAAIGEICRHHAMGLHMDGARFANALVALGCTPADMTWRQGVDVLSFGATKNGTLGAEAIIAFNPSISEALHFRRKRAGHLMSKMRFLSAQMLAYLTDDLWLKNATHANMMAQRLSLGLTAIPGIAAVVPVESNILFCRLPEVIIRGLLDEGYAFYHDRWDQGVIRLVTSFQTSADAVDGLIHSARAIHAKMS